MCGKALYSHVWKKGMQDGLVWCFPGSPQCRSCYVFKPGRPWLWFAAAGHRVSHDMDLFLRTQKVKVLQIMSAMRRWACLPCWRRAIICQGRTAELTLWPFDTLVLCLIALFSPGLWLKMEYAGSLFLLMRTNSECGFGMDGVEIIWGRAVQSDSVIMDMCRVGAELR